MKEKFYIVAERINPQLGTYLSDVYVGTKRVNKQSISCVYERFGEKQTMRFEKYIEPENHSHCDIGGDNCVYGSMAYYGFDKPEDAAAYLTKRWPKHYNFERCMKKLQAA